MEKFNQYTKGQRERINKVGSLYGKEYTEASLIGEVNKIFSNNWRPYRIADGVAIEATDGDLSMTMRFETVKGKKSTYKLLEFKTAV